MKDNIGFSDYTFGVEVEFSNNSHNLNDIYKDALYDGLPVRLQFHHKIWGSKYNRWVLDEDASLSITKNNEIYGGEFSSKILKDNKNDWEEVRGICDLLKRDEAYISEYCSSHITVDISKYLDNPKFFEELYKLIIVFEPEIEVFYLGDYPKVRMSKRAYARCMCFRLLGNINTVNFNDKDFIQNIINNSCAFDIRDGISFYKLIDYGLMEVRYPNGSLNPDTIQNNINFTLSLVDAIGHDKFDKDFLDFLVSKGREEPLMFLYKFLDYFKKDKFKYLTKVISKDDDSYNEFNRQYQKVLSKIKK